MLKYVMVLVASSSHDDKPVLFRAVRPNGKKCADLRARVSSSMLERPLAALDARVMHV